ncbi:hypothetical protein H0H92_007074 [Tricholoma furcatifolium]|nr:hypothetical protein H0H92_007074 [Tricholoma furcatifolium]
MHKTVAEVKGDTDFTKVRDKAKNMHDNAESYALCSQPGALGRRDVHLWNRALRGADYEQMINLARRNSCKLPQRKVKQDTQPITKVSEKHPGGTASHHAVPNSRTENASVAKKSSAVKKAEQHTVKGVSQMASKNPHPGAKPIAGKGKPVNVPAQGKSSQATLNKPSSPKGKSPDPKNGSRKGVNVNAHAAKGSRPAAAKGATQAVSTNSRPGGKPTPPSVKPTSPNVKSTSPNMKSTSARGKAPSRSTAKGASAKAPATKKGPQPVTHSTFKLAGARSHH